MLSLALLMAALAGTIEIQTTLAVDVHLDGLLAAKALGPSTILLNDIPPGEHQLTLYRAGQPHALTLLVQQAFPVQVRVSATDIALAEPPPTAAAVLPGMPLPVLELRSADGAVFLVRLNGAPGVSLRADAPLRLEDLPPGRHTLEISRPDQLVVWVRGILELQPGDQVTLRVAEGRMVEVFGRTEAWIPTR